MSNIQTFTGKTFDFVDLEKNEIDIRDVAHSLANQCRWTGHTKFFYSVARHSLFCASQAKRLGLSKALQYEALMHDAAESVFVDLPRPLKKLLPCYSEMLVKVETFFNKTFGLPEKMSPEVRNIDDRMLITEYRQIIDIDSQLRHPDFENFYVEPFDDVRIFSSDGNFVEDEFLIRYKELKS